MSLQHVILYIFKKIFIFIFSLVKLFERWNKLTLHIVNTEIGYNTEMSNNS